MISRTLFLLVLLTLILGIFLSPQTSVAKDEAEQTPDISTQPLSNWPDEVRTAVIWLNVERKIPYDQIRFDPPGVANYEKNVRSQVFHPMGGKATYQLSPHNKMPMIFNRKNILKGLETDETEIVAILPDVAPAFCNETNKNLGFPREALLQSFLGKLANQENDYDYIPKIEDVPNLEYIGYEDVDVPTTYLNVPRARGCFEMADGKYYYLDALIQR